MGRRGSTLLIALGVVIFLMLAETSLFVNGVTQSNISVRTYNRSNALHLAEAGLSQAALNLRTSSTTDDVTTAALVSGSFALNAPQSVGSNLDMVRSVGTSDVEQRQLEGVFRTDRQSVFQFALFGDQGVDMSGEMRTDSYDSRLGPYDNVVGSPTYNAGHEGDIGTNNTSFGGLDLNGSGLLIDGQLFTGPDVADPQSLVDGYNGNLITGGTDPPTNTQDVGALASTMPMVPVSVPPGVTCADNTVKAKQQVTLSATGGPLGNGTYCYHNLNIEGGATFTADGPVTIYLTGALQAVGETTVGVVSHPSRMLFYITSGGIATIAGTVGGSSRFYGVIYAPDATIAIGGEAQMFGAVVAQDIYVAGDAQVHYDVALKDFTGGPTTGSAELIAWREL